MIIRTRGAPVVLTHRQIGLRRIWAKHYSDGTARMASANEAMAIYPDALAMGDGDRIEADKLVRRMR